MSIPKLSLKLSSSSSKRNLSQSNKLLIYEDFAYHFRSKGKLRFEIEKSKLTFTIKESDKSDIFKQKYKEQSEIYIMKSNVKNVDVVNSNKDNNMRYFFKVNLRDGSNYSFYFHKEQNKDYEKVRDKFVQLLQEDYFSIYKSEFQKMDIETQKKICFLMKNEDLFYLYKKLSKYLFNPEKIYKYLKSLHPERITINLGLNRIQLSRDEELIMSINLSKKKFNVEKLVSADIDISKTYHQSMEKKGYKAEEFWNEFYNQQKENKTYLVGEYNPIINHEDDNEEINNNNLMEALEKNKYYYDTYESNYLHNSNNNNDDYYTKLFKTINNYSMNKMKEINYFSFSPTCINIYNNRISNKNKSLIKKTLSTSLNNAEANMEIESDYNINNNLNNNKQRRLTKKELYDKITQMKKEHEEKKLKKNSNNNTTMKAIIEEIDKIYNLTNIMNFTNNSADDLKDIYFKIFLIKDLSSIYKSEINLLEKKKKTSLLNSKEEQIKKNKIEQLRIEQLKIEHIKTEINNIYSQIEKREYDLGKKSPMKFLLRYAKFNSYTKK